MNVTIKDLKVDLTAQEISSLVFMLIDDRVKRMVSEYDTAKYQEYLQDLKPLMPLVEARYPGSIQRKTLGILEWGLGDVIDEKIDLLKKMEAKRFKEYGTYTERDSKEIIYSMCEIYRWLIKKTGRSTIHKHVWDKRSHDLDLIRNLEAWDDYFKSINK